MSELDRLEAAMNECREMIREAHAATKDLRAAVREARQELRALARDEVAAQIQPEVSRQLEELGERTGEAITAATQKVIAEFDRFGESLLGKETYWQKASGRRAAARPGTDVLPPGILPGEEEGSWAPPRDARSHPRAHAGPLQWARPSNRQPITQRETKRSADWLPIADYRARYCVWSYDGVPAQIIYYGVLLSLSSDGGVTGHPSARRVPKGTHQGRVWASLSGLPVGGRPWTRGEVRAVEEVLVRGSPARAGGRPSRRGPARLALPSSASLYRAAPARHGPDFDRDAISVLISASENPTSRRSKIMPTRLTAEAS